MPSWLDPLLGPEFAAGLAWGLGAVLVALVLDLTKWRQFLTPAGELTAIGALMAMPVTHAVPVAVWQGILALIAAGVVMRVVKISWISPLLAVPGAWLIANSVVGYDLEWVPWFVGAAIVLGGWAAASFPTRDATAQWSPGMHSLFALGIFLSVPDTEEALVLLGAAGSLAMLSLPLSRAKLSAGGAYTLVGASIWVITLGGVGRPASVIGAVACLGVLVVHPIARSLEAVGLLPAQRPYSRRGATGSVLIQLGLVIAMSRSSAASSKVSAASAIAGGLLALVLALSVLSGLPTTPKNTASRAPH